MPQYVAFLRAVNVGGRWVKMAELRECLAAHGFADVETHIQSGNVRVRTSMRSGAKVETAIESALQECFGFAVPAIVRTPRQLRTLAAVVEALDSPLSPEARRYVSFLRAAPSPEAALVIDSWDVPGERCRVIGPDIVVWLDKPSHEATLSNTRTERLTRTASTARDFKVVAAIAEKWGG